jgi:protein-disulfide isomerase
MRNRRTVAGLSRVSLAWVALSTLVLSSGLTGCGDSPSLADTTGALQSPGQIPGQNPGQTSPDKVGFNPFSNDPETATGGREVILNPTVADVMLTGALPEMSFGRSDAPVTLIKYASLTCPYCRKFMIETYPTFKREYLDTGKVRFIIREFPIGKASGTATVALRCAPPEKYLALYEKFLTQQAAWVSQDVRIDAIGRIASQVGITGEQLDACLKNQALVSQLNWVKERGRKLGVIGTPNFFLNGRLIKSVISMPEIRAMVDPLLAGKTSAVSQ